MLAGPRIEVAADAEALARRAAAEVLATLDGALARRPRARWVLAGGSTPRRLYVRLAALPRALDWRRVELWWGDERCLSPDDPGSNYRLARDTLLAELPIPSAQVHRIRGELLPAEAARRYAGEVAAALAAGPFDLVLLGLGADGHLASLFPGASPPAGRLVAAVEGPLPPRRRVTLTGEALARCRKQLFLVAGRDKAAAVGRALAPERDGTEMSDRVRPAGGETVWLLDREAASRLAESRS